MLAVIAFVPLMPSLSSSKGYGEDGLYSEREGLASAPVFGPGLVGKKTQTELNCWSINFTTFTSYFLRNRSTLTNLVQRSAKTHRPHFDWHKHFDSSRHCDRIRTKTCSPDRLVLHQLRHWCASSGKASFMDEGSRVIREDVEEGFVCVFQFVRLVWEGWGCKGHPCTNKVVPRDNSGL